MEQANKSRKEGQTLVMGIGNLLMGDDGVGVHAAQALLKTTLPENVQVLDVGTAFLDALPALEHANRIIVLDAMKADGLPGTVYRTPLDLCQRPERLDSMHGFDMFSLLALAQNDRPVDVVVLGVEPSIIDFSTELSPQVADALPFLLDAVHNEIKIHETC